MTRSILFVCNQNSVRSPMAAALLRQRAPDWRVDSAGVYEGGLDPFVEMVMGEVDVSMADHEPKSLDDIPLEQFDRLVALTPEAATALREKLPDASIEFWKIENPSDAHGGRDAIVDAYRRVRDDLGARLSQIRRSLEKP